jgi:hypothetical protein
MRGLQRPYKYLCRTTRTTIRRKQRGVCQANHKPHHGESTSTINDEERD